LRKAARRDFANKLDEDEEAADHPPLSPQGWRPISGRPGPGLVIFRLFDYVLGEPNRTEKHR
jgi:hypothetical protein